MLYIKTTALDGIIVEIHHKPVRLQQQDPERRVRCRYGQVRGMIIQRVYRVDIRAPQKRRHPSRVLWILTDNSTVYCHFPIQTPTRKKLRIPDLVRLCRRMITAFATILASLQVSAKWVHHDYPSAATQRTPRGHHTHNSMTSSLFLSHLRNAKALDHRLLILFFRPTQH